MTPSILPMVNGQKFLTPGRRPNGQKIVVILPPPQLHFNRNYLSMDFYIDIIQGKNGPIEEDKPQSEVRQEPFSLIKGFEWSNVDLNNPKEQQELYQLLNENYVEDDDNMFRFFNLTSRNLTNVIAVPILSI